MADIAAVSGTLTALRAAYDLSKGFLSIRDAVISQGQILELQRQILSAQESALSAQAAQTSLLEEIDDLKKQIAGFEDWEREKQRYELKHFDSGPIAYALKDEGDPTRPEHYFCACCFEDRRKSYLQPETRYPGRCHVLFCHRCKADIYLSGGWTPQHSGRTNSSRAAE